MLYGFQYRHWRKYSGVDTYTNQFHGISTFILECSSHVEKLCEKNNMKKPLLLGVVNARQVAWGDESWKSHGESLFNLFDERRCFVKTTSEYAFDNRHQMPEMFLTCVFEISRYQMNWLTFLFRMILNYSLMPRMWASGQFVSVCLSEYL